MAEDNKDGSSQTQTGNGEQTQTAFIPDSFKGSTNGELIKYLEGKVKEHEPLTKEKVEKLRRKQKAEGIISGITDAVRAVSNLYFAHNYAPNMYDLKEGSSMSAKAKARFDKAKAERDAEDEAYFNRLMALSKLRGADRDQGLNIWLKERELSRQSEEDARKRELHPYQKSFLESKAEREHGLALDAKQKGEAAGQYYGTRNENERKKGVVLDTQASANVARAAASRADAAASGARAMYYSDKDGSFVVENADGKLRRIKPGELEKEYTKVYNKLSKEQRDKLVRYDNHGMKRDLKPDEKRQVIADYEITQSEKESAKSEVSIHN